MNPRFKATREILRRLHPTIPPKVGKFAEETFHIGVIEKMLPKNIVSNLKDAMSGKAKLNPLHAETIADAMKKWASEKGATHFSHWFQPLTGLAAEKHDSFIDWSSKGELVEKFSGKHLMRGEPDASSFPSGGLRSTSEARGYTVWDPTSLPFLWEMGGTKVLCLPSIFFSWTGKALDMKIPLMRSDAKLQSAALRLLNLLDIEANAAHSTLGCEQEFFLIDRAFYLMRPDLILTGRTLCGASPAKGQELEDHYFGTIKDRVSAFMVDLEHRALALGIPLKTRHSEVAPGQFEFAPLFEKSSIAVDHNVLLMELLRQVAVRHQFTCLLHEKPFAGINGSGKHCNWSIATDKGLNFLDPNGPPMLFLIAMTTIIHAVHQHAGLLRASIGSAANDHRLGGHEAPPAIISVYLGEALEKWLSNIEADKAHQTKEGKALDLGIPPIPDIPLDETDRNRTSPFAFTGNKFEFRAVGASQNCALPITVLNVIVADSLNQIIDEIEKGVMKKKKLKDVVFETVRKFLKASKAIRFTGDNYSAAWKKEAKKRHLPVIEKSLESFDAFVTQNSVKVFEGVLSKQELESRTEIFKERYRKIQQIETRLLNEILHTQILPVAIEYNIQAKAFPSIGKKLSLQINKAIKTHAREDIDALEMMVDDRLWPLPKYREMLHIL